MKIIPAPAYFLLAVSLFVSPSLPAESGPPIRLVDYRFDPLISLPVAPAPRAKIADPSGRGYYLLQFPGPVREEWKELCESRGVEFLDYIPDFAFIVRMDDRTRAEVVTFPLVRWIGNYEPAFRLPARLKNRPAKEGGGVGEYVVTVFPGADMDAVLAGVKSSGGEVLRRTDSDWKTRLRVVLEPDRPELLAALPGVKWVEEPPRWRYSNNQARTIVKAESAWNRSSYFGAGQIVGVVDGGLDRGSLVPAQLHQDFLDGDGASRVIALSTTWTDWTDGKDFNGHGTHVAGSIIGSGKLSGANPANWYYPASSYAGVAPEARMVFQSVGDFSLMPDDLNQVFAQAYGAGVRVHNNSWGEAAAGQYTSSSEDVDEFSWIHRDFLSVFAAGDSGTDSNSSGVVDLYSLDAPATAKNCLAVGASESYRPPSSLPAPGRPLTYGWYWPWDYPAAPISGDYLSDNPDGMAAISSRGPALPGRWKPELVAPGTNLISCRTGEPPSSKEILWGSGGLAGADAANYVFSGGTSMAAPLVTGAAALVREYYTRAGHTPSAALLKATLVNGARDISPGQYGVGQYREIPAPPRPNNVSGWGRLDLGSTVFSSDSPDFSYFDVSPGLSTGGVQSYPIPVSYSLSPLSVTLCWTDYPGSTPAGGALVNDLDLTVTGPDGTVHYPNNARTAEYLFYEDGERTGTRSAFEGVIQAVRFTPGRYPARLERGMFYLLSESGSYPKTFQYRVYRGGSSGPGTLLATGYGTLKEEGWHSIDLSGQNIAINSGDYFLGIVIPDYDLSWAVSDVEPIAGRSWEWVSGIGWWKLEVEDYLFRAVVSTPTLHDRTNNTLGIDIEYPVPGTYTVTVSGYNVPFGPQPYALVVSRPDRGMIYPDRPVIASGDYSGDGTSDLAIFRPATGLWAVRGLTRVYYGGMGDVPASGDYTGNGTTDLAVFRPSTGLWSVRGVTRAYFGGAEDLSVPGDYNGDGRTDIAVFRSGSGLWAVRGLTRFYFGRSGDIPVPGDYDSFHPGRTEPAVFRPSTGLWAIRNLDRVYFGASGDTPVPARYDELPGDDVAVFRPSSGLWAVYDFGRFYFGGSGDIPVPADYTGEESSPPAVFRPASGLWAISGVTRTYFGREFDIPVAR